MACKMIVMVLAMIFVVSISGGAMAEPGCTSAVTGMSSCVTFIAGNSSTPSDKCCSQIVDVVQSQPQCLCEVLNGVGLSHGITFNRTLALTLPGACNVQTPTVSKCKATFDLFGSPEGSIPEQDSSPEGPSESGSESKKDGSKSNTSELRAPIHLLVFVLFLISWTFTTASF